MLKHTLNDECRTLHHITKNLSSQLSKNIIKGTFNKFSETNQSSKIYNQNSLHYYEINYDIQPLRDQVTSGQQKGSEVSIHHELHGDHQRLTHRTYPHQFHYVLVVEVLH